MSKGTGRFSKDKQPPKGRGRSFKTKLMESLKRQSLVGATPKIKNETAEGLFIDHWVTRALDTSDTDSTILLKELVSRSYSSLKPTMPLVDFDYDENSSPSNQVMQILKATSEGGLPPDVAFAFMNAVKVAGDIEQQTDLKARIEELENMMNG